MKASHRLLFQELTTLQVPPGEGVYTVHTAQDRKTQISKLLWKSSQLPKVRAKFNSHLLSLEKNQLPVVFGICADTGGGIIRGANWGPLFIREALYSPLKNPHNSYFDAGDSFVVPHLLHDKYLNKSTIQKIRHAIFPSIASKKNLPVSPLSIAERSLELIYQINPHTVVFGLGGDHSVSYPLVKAFLKNQKKISRINKTAFLHFDAHTDLLEHRLGVDICFGSWASHILKIFPHPENFFQIGIRSSGKSKSHWEKKFGITQIWAKEFQAQGVEKTAKKIAKTLINNGIEDLYISFDIDALDSNIAGRTGTPEKNGLLPHQILAFLEFLSPNFYLKGLDLVEIAPFIDPQDQHRPEKDGTLDFAQSLISLAHCWHKRGFLGNY